MTEQQSQTPPPLKVILASKSPRRRDLLKEAGIKFTVRTPIEPVDETLDADELMMPVEAVKKLAERKAGAFIQELIAENPQGLFMVLGADTMVVKGGDIFGKPRNLDDAKRMLGELSGVSHDVITAVSVWMLAADGENVSLAYRTFADKSVVTFKELTEEGIIDYLRKGESFDKAGAYAIQGEGRALVESYDGSLDTIVGFPVKRLIQEFPDIVSAI
ncbi:MAG: septum formation protein Maf [Eggerthellaceae bacterium]|nr:septum formation protein Maf [Eggerthellaceae bacterium]